MSLIDFLKKSAQAAAKEGLEKLGVKYKPHVEALQDDPDTHAPDIFEIYKDIAQRRSVPQLSEDDRAFIKKTCDEILTFAGNNDDLRTHLTRCAEMERSPADTRKKLRTELIDICTNVGVLQPLGENYLKAAQAAAAAQNRMVRNLLFQANAQVCESSLPDWISAMNDRLAPFNIALLCIDKKFLTLQTLDLTPIDADM